ncbi:MAG: hypothetical protein ACWGNB_01135 [Thiogranum sp.]
MRQSEFYFTIFGQRIRVRCDDDAFRPLVLANYEAFRDAEGPVDLDYDVSRPLHGGFSIGSGGETLVDERGDQAVQYMFLYMLEKQIALDLQKRRTDLYFIHASALERRGRVSVISAASGTGKSTTAWALLGHGFRYLSDELAPIVPDTFDVHPYPHALCLKAAPPGPYPLPQGIVRTERTMHVPVSMLPAGVVPEPSPLHALFFLRRDTSRSRPAFSRLSPAEAGARLYTNTLNALAHPASGLSAAIDIAGAAPAFLIDVGDLRATCELIADLEERAGSITLDQ